MKKAKIIFRKTLKGILWTLSVLVAGIGIWFLCAWVLPNVKVNTDRKAPEGTTIDILIKSNGVHTDFVLPVKSELMSWDSLFPASTFERVDSTSTHLAFGWGDKGFFLETPTWADLKASTALKAAFWLSESAMHLTYYRQEPAEAALCRKIKLSKAEYQKLCAYILSSFRRNQSGNVQRIDHAGYSGQDNFYEGSGTYNLFKTCNEWTGDGLQFCGYPIGVWTPLQGGVMDELKE